MKRTIFLLAAVVVVCLGCCSELCQAQLMTQVTSEKTITTTSDTLRITGKDLILVSLFIQNRSLTDTLQWRTDNDTTWRTQYPNTWYADKMYMKYLYRKAKSGTGLSCKTWAE